ncbi:MAG: AMP-binding protein [Alphaproteobacteria bacterium]|nr:AMP-binding protein [Alphaproteobacteria bacterium]
MSKYYDTLETRDPAEREKAQMTALPAQIAHAKANSSYFAESLKDIDAAGVTSRAALARLPVLRKSALGALQKAKPPMGGLLGVPMNQIRHIFMSPGPIFEVDTDEKDFFRGARGMYAAGFRSSDIVHNTYSYHLTPAGMMMESSIRAIGCAVIPAGVGNTELQLDAIELIKPTAYVGTPSFLRILLEKAKELGRDVSSIKKAVVGAEAFPPPLRKEFNERGIFALQGYGTADLGSIAYESEAIEGMIIDEGVIVEIVRPGTGDPVPEGEVGEVVVTTFNKAYPLVRFGTGDLSAVMSGISPCGRTNTRIKGWMGRADQRTKVKGMFVDPEQVIAVQKRHPELAKVRLVVDWVDKQDVMTLHAEIAGGGSPDLAKAVEASIQNLCKVRGGVSFTAPGSLANDGKVIADVRKYD